jgi:hypothetical protein
MQQPFVPNQQPSVWKIGESARSGVPELSCRVMAKSQSRDSR